MSRDGYYKKNDQMRIASLQKAEPNLTDDDATMILRSEWIAQIATCYMDGTQPGFGGGFTPDDEIWLAKVEAAIKNKTSPRPTHPDSVSESALSKAGV